jgi:RNA polymerase sigma factor (sigma-70 family)
VRPAASLLDGTRDGRRHYARPAGEHAQGPPERTSTPARERPCGPGHRPATPGTRTSWSCSRCSGGWWAPGCATRTPSTTSSREALARVIAARGRLDDEAVTPYAIVTARNLVTSLAREEERGRRHRPRLVDLSEPERPEDAALRQEEAAAVEAALAGLPDHERDAMVAHEVEGVDTATLAEARRSTPGAVGVQLARTRARLWWL